MWRDRMIEQNRILHLAGIADHAMIADQNMFTYVCIVSNLTMASDNRRPFNNRAIFDHRPLSDVHLLANVRHPLTTIVQRRSHIGPDNRRNLFQRIPGKLAPIKNAGARALSKIEQICWLQHRCESKRKPSAMESWNH